MNKNLENTLAIIAVGLILIVGVGTVIGGGFGINACYTQYNVWKQGKEGQAELMKADWNRQILVREAKAKEQSAVLLAHAEVERAVGVAKANKIIGQSLEKNEAYLRYLWINNLANEHNQVIYVPTEANLPILEATRFNHKK